MKRRIVPTALVLIVLTAAALVFPAGADKSGAADEIGDGICAYMLASCGAGSVQEWIDTDLTEKAGLGSEWYIIALSQSGARYDYSKYISALNAYLDGKPTLTAASSSKFALTLLACGCGEDGYVSETLRETEGAQGVMNVIYRLHLLNNIQNAEKEIIDPVIDGLLSLQKDDGGWSLFGEYGDADVTSMALQALSYHRENEDVGAAIGRALDFLSNRQREDGGYISAGASNPESAAQVLTALSALNINAASDERFIKNGRTVFDAISAFRLEDGSFCHAAGKGQNAMATQQVFYSMIAYKRYESGRSPLYILDAVYAAKDDAPKDGAADNAHVEKANEGEKTRSEKIAAALKSFFPPYKIIACSAILLAGGAACLTLGLFKRKRFTDYLIVIISVVLLIALVLFVNIRSKESYYDGVGETIGEPAGSVTLTIRCDVLKGETLPSGIPEDAVIVRETSYPIKEGETVYELLIDAARKEKLLIDGDGGYIRAINNLRERDYGELSGWMYYVNGAAPDTGCGSCRLKDGDIVEWRYTKELGNDH